MNISIIPFNKTEHLPLIKKWWAFYYEGEDFPDYCVPQHGVVAMIDNQPIGSVFLYVNDTKICQMIFPVVDPDVKIRDKISVIDQLLEGAKSRAKEILGDICIVFALTHNNSVERSLQKCGFRNTGDMKTLAYPFGDAYIDFIE